MKLRNIFTILAAVATLAFAGCQEKERFLDEVTVSQSYVAIPAEGGSVTITLNAVADWEFAVIKDVWPVVVERDKDGKETSSENSWISVDKMNGPAGENKVTFSATAAESTREQLLYINCDGATQVISVLQMTEKVELPITDAKFVNEQGVDGTVYRVKGQVTSIANTEYGNFYIKDETGVAYVYGCLYDGQEKQFSKHGIAVGDVVTVEGPRKDYNGTIELVNVTVIEIVKSLLVVDPMDVEIEKEAGNFTVGVSNKGFCTVDIDVDWIKFDGLGTDKAMFTYEAYEVMGSPRTATITFTVVKDDRESVVPVKVTQYGITPDPIAVAEAIKQANNTWLTVEGIVTGVHDKGIIVTDAAGDAIYGYVNAKPEAKRGDKVLLTGKLGDYKQFFQIASPVVRVQASGEKYTLPTPVTPTEATFTEWGSKKQSAQFVSVTGVADKDNYGAVTVAGYTVSPYYISSSFKYDKLYGKNVTIKGYTAQLDGKKKDLRIIVTSVEEAK